MEINDSLCLCDTCGNSFHFSSGAILTIEAANERHVVPEEFLENFEIRQQLEELTSIEDHLRHLHSVAQALERRQRHLQHYVHLRRTLCQAYVLRLPDDLLAEIFSICYDGAEDHAYRINEPGSQYPALILSQVCHQWREVALQFGRFWSQIEVRIDNWKKLQQLKPTFNRARLFLARARSYPLDINLELPARDFPCMEYLFPAAIAKFGALLDVFRARSPQWRSASIVAFRKTFVELFASPLNLPLAQRLTMDALESDLLNLYAMPNLQCRIASAECLHSLECTGNWDAHELSLPSLASMRLAQRGLKSMPINISPWLQAPSSRLILEKLKPKETSENVGRMRISARDICIFPMQTEEGERYLRIILSQLSLEAPEKLSLGPMDCATELTSSVRYSPAVHGIPLPGFELQQLARNSKMETLTMLHLCSFMQGPGVSLVDVLKELSSLRHLSLDERCDILNIRHVLDTLERMLNPTFFDSLADMDPVHLILPGLVEVRLVFSSRYPVPLGAVVNMLESRTRGESFTLRSATLVRPKCVKWPVDDFVRLRQLEVDLEWQLKIQTSAWKISWDAT
ncbi:hypothetical protein VKT23_000280 [Stygiomarasmius scandens]|uniref:F-box domain-containing protein n=1 Tax=Marasmiellus scandens TaxID=2682957 RepID=A0ABR1K928_9AGAR